jgi:LPXTG-motif cell wall-anchored protein
MKKTIMVISLTAIFAINGLNLAVAQEQPKLKKDTVNMDTDARPEVYYEVEDDKVETHNASGKSATGTIAIIAGTVILIGAAAFFLLKKKK